jgi:hypothetical protein
MSGLTKHLVLPAIAPAAIVGLYFTPVMLFGCVNRGLIAIAVALISAGAAFVTTRIGVKARGQGQPWSGWLVSTVILLSPLCYWWDH